MREGASKVFVSESIKKYILDIVTATRKHAGVLAGASTRGTLALLNASKAYAYTEGRDYVIPDDVKCCAPYVLSHRVSLKAQVALANESAGMPTKCGWLISCGFAESLS